MRDADPNLAASVCSEVAIDVAAPGFIGRRGHIVGGVHHPQVELIKHRIGEQGVGQMLRDCGVAHLLGGPNVHPVDHLPHAGDAGSHRGCHPFRHNVIDLALEQHRPVLARLHA